MSKAAVSTFLPVRGRRGEDTSRSTRRPRPIVETEHLRRLLDIASILLSGLGPSFSPEVRKVQDLGQRLAEERFHLAVLGQFKRGKSTLVNSLLGEEALPTSVVPLTAIPTFLRAGEVRRVEVVFENGRTTEKFTASDGKTLRDFLDRFVTEDGNPKNCLGVSRVEVSHPAAILGQGMVLIDTPGIGSTLRHNTETTLNFVPQCDAGLFVVSADPPLTEVEVEFLKQLRGKTSHLFFLLTKADYLSPEDRLKALDFLTRTLLEEVGLSNETPIFCVSAKQGLEARQTGNSDLWRKSGLADLEGHLIEFMEGEKSRVLREAVTSKAANAISGAILKLQLMLRSLRMPIEDLQERLQIFKRKIQEVERERQTAKDLLAGDQKRVIESLEKHSERLRSEARHFLEEILNKGLAQEPNGDVNEPQLQEALAEAIPGYFERKFGETAERFRASMAEALRPRQTRADQLIESIRRKAAELFEVPFHAPESESPFEMVREPYWVQRQWSSTMTPLPEGWMDRFLPKKMQRRRALRRLYDRIRALVISNVENLRWATYQSITETVRRFGSNLDERLSETLEATHGAIQSAADRRQSQNKSVEEETAKLDAAIEELQQIRSDLERNHAVFADGEPP